MAKVLSWKRTQDVWTAWMRGKMASAPAPSLAKPAAPAPAPAAPPPPALLSGLCRFFGLIAHSSAAPTAVQRRRAGLPLIT